MDFPDPPLRRDEVFRKTLQVEVPALDWGYGSMGGQVKVERSDRDKALLEGPEISPGFGHPRGGLSPDPVVRPLAGIVAADQYVSIDPKTLPRDPYPGH